MPGVGLSPLEAAVLVAVARGARTPGEIARILNVSEEDVERVVDRLVAKGLLARVKKKILFVRRVELRLTEKGYNALPEAERVLREAAERLRRAAEALRDSRIATPYNPAYAALAPGEELLLVAPMLAWLGLLPAATLAALEAIEHIGSEAGWHDSEANDAGEGDDDDGYEVEVEVDDGDYASDYTDIDGDDGF